MVSTAVIKSVLIYRKSLETRKKYQDKVSRRIILPSFEIDIGISRSMNARRLSRELCRQKKTDNYDDLYYVRSPKK